MATYEQGILGSFSGKVGPVVGSTWKGKNVMKGKSRKRSGGSSVKPLDQQLKFATVAEFQIPFGDLLDVTFKHYAVDMTAQNAAFSYNFPNVLTGKSPDYEIDYSKALMSRGSLPNAGDPKAITTGGAVFFTWTDNSGMGKAVPTDKAVLLLYCKENNAATYTWAGPARSENAAQLDAALYAGTTLQTWLGFISEDGALVSGSIFTGELVITK